MTDASYQEGFLGGLSLGLDTALVILRDAGPADNDYVARVAEGIRKVQCGVAEARAANERLSEGRREAVAGDLFVGTPMAHPGDLGLPSTAADDDLATLTRMKPYSLKPAA